MPDIVWWLFVAVTLAGCRQAYLHHEDRRVPPLDPFWTDPD